MIRKSVIIFSLLFLPLALKAQDDDFGIWTSLETRFGLSRKLSMDVTGSLRTYNNSSKIDEVFAEGGLNYKISKFLGVSASYRLTDRQEDNGDYYLRHKIYFAVRSSVSAGNFTFSGRLMYQRATKTYIEDDSDLSAVCDGRVKLKAYYNIPRFPVNPYVSYETFCRLTSGADRTVGKNRFSGGAELKINRRNSVELEYIFQRDYLPHLADESILSVNYKIKF
jgi:hypothetical protein